MGTDEQRYRSEEKALWDAEGATPDEHWIRLADTGTGVRVQSVGDGPPVLFLHGVGNSGTSWAALAARLAGFRCLVVDRPGCGLSEPVPTPFDGVPAFASFADSLVARLLDGLELDRAHVVCTSLGGFFGLRAAAATPDRVRHLVELGWTVGAPVGEIPLVMRIASNPRLGSLMTRLPMNDRAARAMLARIGLRQALAAGRVSDELVGWFRAQANHTDTMRNEILAGPRLMTWKGLDEAILLDDALLASVTSPTLFVWGAEDPFGGEDVARRFVPRVPGARLELVPGAGHAVWLDQPDRVATLVQEFLRSPVGSADPAS